MNLILNTMKLLRRNYNRCVNQHRNKNRIGIEPRDTSSFVFQNVRQDQILKSPRFFYSCLLMNFGLLHLHASSSTSHQEDCKQLSSRHVLLMKQKLAHYNKKRSCFCEISLNYSIGITLT